MIGKKPKREWFKLKKILYNGSSAFLRGLLIIANVKMFDKWMSHRLVISKL